MSVDFSNILSMQHCNILIENAFILLYAHTFQQILSYADTQQMTIS